ncbi:efflux RND transporter periplasmic adaptor subunit [Rubinisphaera italica]|uniref:HlyD family secretion protein n=1 Tax=Rubinisphaera italica TaxID=2527969 RepID=A0A5C5XAH4_9PLAN|nr:efflux RND transporter periplasmic adaptor subunit [Rubinisphaera italica]TWT59778.1 hypothetical protein Pan54_04880 [Rubinisphaera italica]
MTEPVINPPDNPTEQIALLIDEIARLAETDLGEKEFYQELLGRLTEIIPQQRSIAWRLLPSGWEVVAQAGSRIDEDSSSVELAQLDEMRVKGDTRFLLPDPNQNDLIAPVLLSSVTSGDECYAVLEIQFRETEPKFDHATIQQLCRVISDLAAAYHRQQMLRTLKREQAWWQALDQFSQSIHASLNRTEVCYTIANEGRRAVGCDRLTVFTRHRGTYRAAAISGLDSINRRANSVRRLEDLIKIVLPLGEPVEYPNESSSFPSHVEAAFVASIDESDARQIRVAPLVDRGDSDRKEKDWRPPIIIGGIVAEQFAGKLVDHERLTAIAQHATTALRNVNQHHGVFLLPLWSALGQLSWIVRARTLPKTLLVVMLLVSAIAALIGVPAEFELQAEGTLQPVEQRFVFAPENGVVDQLFVSHQSEVVEDEELLQLRSAQMNLQLEEVEGELETTIKKIAVIAAATADVSSGELTRARYNQMIAEREELVTWRDSLIKQREMLQKRFQALTLRSEINGQVITANLAELLAGRPVSRGQILMTVARLDGEWELDLLLPDKRIGHLDHARRTGSEDLNVEFILATEPETTRSGTIREYGDVTMLNESQTDYGLPIKVAFEEKTIAQLRPGARVIAKIQCGQRPLGYVWFHDVYEFLQTQWFRYF